MPSTHMTKLQSTKEELDAHMLSDMEGWAGRDAEPLSR